MKKFIATVMWAGSFAVIMGTAIGISGRIIEEALNVIMDCFISKIMTFSTSVQVLVAVMMLIIGALSLRWLVTRLPNILAKIYDNYIATIEG